MKAPITRTLGQIHLEDLEPHRFEDLVRQLLYDFRPWRSLEATGRSGGDDGFDARGREIVPRQDALDQPADDQAVDQADDDGGDQTPDDDRLWMIQCKRERSIGPAKAQKYLVELSASFKPTAPYGLVFVAACDLSKTTRDAIFDGARALGFMEVHIWAKGEIEDQLFQPKNDHLLFAYTGISLQIRRKSARTEVRAKLAAKRKLLRTLEGAHLCLILEATDQRFPQPSGPEGGHWSRRRHWNVYYPGRCAWDGLRVILKRCWAIYDPASGEWDVAESTDSGKPGQHNDPWFEGEDSFDQNHGLWEFWSKLGMKQAMYVEEAVLPYQTVIDVEAHLDTFFDGAVIYVDDFHSDYGPFLPEIRHRLEPSERWAGWAPFPPDPEMRRKLFPEAGQQPVQPPRIEVPPDDPLP